MTTVIEARSKQFSSEKIKTVGILFDYDHFMDYDYFRMLFTDLGLNDNRLRFIVFYEKKIINQTVGTLPTPKKISIG